MAILDAALPARDLPDPASLPQTASEPVGLLHAWWRGDLLPDLAPLPGLTIGPAAEADVVGLSGIDRTTVEDRLCRGHRPWLARWVGEPVAVGWVAGREAAIGELGLAFAVPPANRYLWDFLTLPPWRGRGIYTRLLRAIVAREVAERFWVGHDLANLASARGIARAGFDPVGTVHRLADGRLAFAPSRPGERAVAAAALLGLSHRGGIAS